MPDPQVSPTPRNWKKLGILAVVLALVLGAGGILFWLRPLHSTRPTETSGVQSTLGLETFVRKDFETCSLELVATIGLGKGTASAVPLEAARNGL